MKNLISIFTICVVIIFLAGCEQRPQVAAIYKKAPDFTLADIKGKTWTLSDLRGKVVFVNFWATWCAPCIEEMPSMQKLYSRLSKDQFEMLAVLSKDDLAKAEKFAAKLGITMPILNDPASTIGPKYGLTGLPDTFIVDKRGIVREKFIGPRQWDAPKYHQMIMEYINQ